MNFFSTWEISFWRGGARWRQSFVFWPIWVLSQLASSEPAHVFMRHLVVPFMIVKRRGGYFFWRAGRIALILLAKCTWSVRVPVATSARHLNRPIFLFLYLYRRHVDTIIGLYSVNGVWFLWPYCYNPFRKARTVQSLHDVLHDIDSSSYSGVLIWFPLSVSPNLGNFLLAAGGGGL